MQAIINKFLLGQIDLLNKFFLFNHSAVLIRTFPLCFLRQNGAISCQEKSETNSFTEFEHLYYIWPSLHLTKSVQGQMFFNYLFCQ